MHVFCVAHVLFFKPSAQTNSKRKGSFSFIVQISGFVRGRVRTSTTRKRFHGPARPRRPRGPSTSPLHSPHPSATRVRPG